MSVKVSTQNSDQKHPKLHTRQVEGELYPNNPDGFVGDLRVEVEDLGYLSKRFKGSSGKTSICFPSTSKMSHFMTSKEYIGLSVHKDGEEVLFSRRLRLMDTASAMNHFYYCDRRKGLKKVSLGEKGVRITSFHEFRRPSGDGKLIRAFMHKTALFLKDTPSSAVAIMLNHKGEKKHILWAQNQNAAAGGHCIVDLATCDHGLGRISTLFTLGEEGSLSCFKVSKHCKILVKTDHFLPASDKIMIYNCLAVSHDGEYAAVLANKKRLMVLKVGLGRRVEVLSTLESNTFPKNISCMGFYQIHEDVDQGEAEKHHLRFLYLLGDSKFVKSQIAFLTFNIKTNNLEDVMNLVKDLSPIKPIKCVQHREGGNWIVTSGTNAIFAKVRLVLFRQSKQYGWFKNSN